MGWCYGDIGTSIALRASGEIAENEIISKLAYDIALHAALYRRDLKSNFINDACLCHGSSGVAHFFHNCFRFYKDPVYLQAYQKWYDITLSMYENINGEKMFGFYKYDLLKKQKSLSILEGDTGVGLLLMGEYELLDDYLIYNF